MGRGSEWGWGLLKEEKKSLDVRVKEENIRKALLMNVLNDILFDHKIITFPNSKYYNK